MARHPEGLELVRIGKPLRPEFAAWRYGDQFGRRRRRTIVYTTGFFAGSVVGSALMGITGSIAGLMAMSIWSYADTWQTYRHSIRFRPSDGQVRGMNRLIVAHTLIRPYDDEVGFLVGAGKGILKPREIEWFAGEDARRAINAILPAINRGGGKLKEVRSAVSEIESHGHPERFVHQATERWREYRHRGTCGFVGAMPPHTRLAFEMALHEEEERRALEGELWRLEQAWREAEEIAAIADDLVLPKGASGFVDRHRG